MIGFLLGCCLGSFFCLIAQRIPRGESCISPRSHCSNCQTPLAFFELIPIVSILGQKFKCRHCKAPIAFTYLAAEMICGGLFWAIGNLPAPTQVTAAIWLSGAFLLSLTDWFYMIVEPKILYPITGLLWLSQFLTHQPFHMMNLLILLPLGSFYYLGMMGGGDLLLLATWLPWLSLIEVVQLLFLASFLGLLTIVLYWLFRKEQIRQLPFVPFLTAALFFVHFIELKIIG